MSPRFLGLAILVLTPCPLLAGDPGDAIVGAWLTGKDKGEQGIVRFFKSGNGYAANVVEENSRGATVEKPLIVGIVYDTAKREWVRGRLTDPRNGKEYSCVIAISDDRQQMRMRGYLGISLLGRTQTWTRLPTASSSAQKTWP